MGVFLCQLTAYELLYVLLKERRTHVSGLETTDLD